MQCPHCTSTDVHPSRRHDSLVFRLLLVARMRCHACQRKFFALAWRRAA
ncbi:hypothetical protein Pla175_27960 [Pirellulimonas nuda]|uniref:Uncharacterized protein n=1 Tax=Pirellulimonas nuda TaxID=2528009 RepID=A0A518DD93_9BACT|nr:hypothetical protein Pla175_27960 [Pirellulimonas nuda]